MRSKYFFILNKNPKPTHQDLLFALPKLSECLLKFFNKYTDVSVLVKQMIKPQNYK